MLMTNLWELLATQVVSRPRFGRGLEVTQETNYNSEA